MLKNIIFSAFGAGIAVALCVTAIQLLTTEPLILGAEVFEKAGEPVVAMDHRADAGMETPAVAASAPAAHEHDEGGWQPADGFERTAYTVLANLLVGVGVSLMLLGAMVVKGEPIDARRGALWGVFGFIAASLLPSLGLPPELPGSAAADITTRQVWWLTTAAASGFGLALMIFARSWPPRIAGLALLVAPHLIGAPEPPTLAASYPAGMAGEFVIASMVLSLIVWSVSGLVGGWLHQRLAGTG